ncbi:MAG TPA: hypothetical protein PLE60_13755 [Candidatus Latescibacteria bacterium]|nr:hypothetical protein [Candidatus Latescibacterota bacterium]
MNPDRRDVAAFIFFEISAQYENFCCEALEIEVRKRFGVEPKHAVNIMGSSDKGLTGTMGWGAPDVVQSRAQNLLGKSGFFGRFEDILGKPTYDTLAHAHKVRNRIAHGGTKAITDYNRILAQLGVPVRSRRGLSAGRLLMEYPGNVAQGDRWFSRFITAYQKVIEEYDRVVVIR